MKTRFNARLLTLEPEDMQETLLLWEACLDWQKLGIIHPSPQPMAADGTRRFVVCLDLAAMAAGSCWPGARESLRAYLRERKKAKKEAARG